MTIELFREDGYLQSCTAVVTAVHKEAIELNQTVFYPTGGGQPGDTGNVQHKGTNLSIMGTIKDRDTGAHLHLIEAGHGLTVNDEVEVSLDWARRHKLMRLHSCMHMLCAVVPAAVTGGSIRDDDTARLDFDLPEPPDKELMQAQLNALTSQDNSMSLRWISAAQLLASPELVRTMSVQPPMDSGKVRLVQFGDVDLQPCGGTHVANSNEIGAVTIQSIKKKGKQNRRITVALNS